MDIPKHISKVTTTKYEFSQKLIEQLIRNYLTESSGTDHSQAEVYLNLESSPYVIFHQYSEDQGR